MHHQQKQMHDFRPAGRDLHAWCCCAKPYGAAYLCMQGSVLMRMMLCKEKKRPQTLQSLSIPSVSRLAKQRLSHNEKNHHQPVVCV